MSRSMIWRRKSRPADELGERRSGIRLGDGAGREQPGRQRSRCSGDGCGQQPGGCMPRRRAPVHPGSGTGSPDGPAGDSGPGPVVARLFKGSIFSGLLAPYSSKGIGLVLFGNSTACLFIALPRITGTPTPPHPTPEGERKKENGDQGPQRVNRPSIRGRFNTAALRVEPRIVPVGNENVAPQKGQ